MYEGESYQISLECRVAEDKLATEIQLVDAVQGRKVPRLEQRFLLELGPDVNMGDQPRLKQSAHDKQESQQQKAIAVTQTQVNVVWIVLMLIIIITDRTFIWLDRAKLIGVLGL